MPTENPRITFTVSEELKEQINEFQFSNRIKNQSQAILALIGKGMDSVEHESGNGGALYNGTNNSLSHDALRIARIYDELPDNSKKFLLMVAERERNHARNSPAAVGFRAPILAEAVCDGSVEVKDAAHRERRDAERSGELSVESNPL